MFAIGMPRSVADIVYNTGSGHSPTIVQKNWTPADAKSNLGIADNGGVLRRRLLEVMRRPLWRCCVAIGFLSALTLANAQRPFGREPSATAQTSPTQTQSQEPESSIEQQAESELRTGTALTSRGQFTEAIPHLLAARGRVKNEYAARFNLAICYIAIEQPRQAIPILMELQRSGHDSGDVNNLLAQAYVGDAQDEKALDALQRAMSFTPTNEKLYTFVADACMGRQSYTLGLQVVDLGLKNLPNSGRLHFERGMFLALMDRFDSAKNDFELARKLAPDSDIAYIASAQEAMYAGNIEEAVRVSREGMAKGIRHFLLLTLFGEASLRSGITPGQKEFQEARAALEAAVANKPNYPSSQLSLGKLYLLDGQTAEALTCLEKALALNPRDPAVYAALASAYRKAGDTEKAQATLAKLAELNHAQAEKIRTGTGETKASYGGTASQHP